MEQQKILFVCTGNICRSPMAAALFEAETAGEGGFTAGSVGLKGLDGQQAHPLARALMRKRGMDISNHRARTVTPKLLKETDLVLVMETNHLNWIREKMPTVQHSVYLLGHWRNLEITDPINGGDAEFERSAGEIAQCVGDWVRHLRQKLRGRLSVESNSACKLEQ